MARSLRSLAETPVTRVEGVGDKKAESLEQVGITSVLDLLQHYPRRWLDRTNQAQIRDLRPGAEAWVLATVQRASTRRTRRGQSAAEIDVADGSGHLRLTFFNQPWWARKLPAGTEAAFFGKVDIYRGRRQMTNPEVSLIGDTDARIVPLYPQSDKADLTSREYERWIANALKRLDDLGGLVDPVPSAFLGELDVVSRTWAMHQIHAPESMGAKEAAR